MLMHFVEKAYSVCIIQYFFFFLQKNALNVIHFILNTNAVTLKKVAFLSIQNNKVVLKVL